MYGPCAPYLTAEEAAGFCSDCTLPAPEAPGYDAAVAELEAALLWASRRVFMATGYRFFGECSAVIRPCRKGCSGLPASLSIPSDWPYPAWPVPIGAEGYVNVWACGCSAGDPCSCTSWDRLPLPYLPARSVTDVTIDGTALDPGAYRVVAEAWLERIDGEAWPVCQDVGAPLTEVGTWGYTLSHGLDLPPEGLPLVSAYACELLKSCAGGECALPAGVRVVSRDGVEFAVAEPSEFRELGLTGFGPLDDWIMLLNGGHVTEPPRIYRPGREAPAPILGG